MTGDQISVIRRHTEFDNKNQLLLVPCNRMFFNFWFFWINYLDSINRKNLMELLLLLLR